MFRDFLILLAVPLRRGVNALRRPGETRWGRRVFLVFIGLWIAGMAFGLLRLVFGYLYRQPVIGPLLVGRFFSMVFLVFLFMLVYSNILASLSSHFLSRDLPLLHAGPARPRAVFWAKAMEALAGSSWMVVFMCVPFYAAFGWVRGVGGEFYLYALGATVPFLLIPAAVSMTANTALMYVFPARRFREIMLLVGTLMFCAVMIGFRFLEPERLVSLEDEMEVLEFMKMLAAPSAPYLPSAWAGTAIMAAANVDRHPLGYWANTALLWAAAVGAWAAALALGGRWYRGAWQQANESLGVKRGVRLARSWLPLEAGPYLSVLIKDLKIFLREPSQWGQVLLLASLVLIYLFSLAKVPAAIGQGLRSLLFFLNLGFIGLILTAVAARFLFPLISLEAGSFQVLRTSPISMRRYLWTRLGGGVLPLLGLGLVLVAFSVPLLQVDRFMAFVAFFSIACMTVAVGSLAVGCGAAFAKFRISNPEEIVTSAGGFIYMALAMAYIMGILVIEAAPVRLYYRAALFNRPFTEHLLAAGALSVVAILTVTCVLASVRLGARSLEAREL